MADLDEVLHIVNATLGELRLHDQRVEFNVASMKAGQDRMGEAIEKIADATQAIRLCTEEIKRRNGQPIITRPEFSWKLTPRSAAWIVGGSLAVGAALAGGNEVAHRILHLIPGMPGK